MAEPELSDQAFKKESRTPMRVGLTYLAILFVVSICAVLYAGGLFSG